MPDYGFSGPTRDTGWNVRRIASAWVELMARLGHDRYGAQGLGELKHFSALEEPDLLEEDVRAFFESS